MTPRLSRRATVTLVALLVAILAGLVLVRNVARNAVASRLRSAAAERGLTVSWRGLALEGPSRVRLHGLVLTRPPADTLFRADSLQIALDPWSFATGRPQISSLELAHANGRWKARADADTLAPEDLEEPPAASARLEKLRRGAEGLIRLLLAPARRLPRLAMRDVTLEGPPGEDALIHGARIASLNIDRSGRGLSLRVEGALELEHQVPFEATLDYGHDDRLVAVATLQLPTPNGRGSEPLRIAVEGALQQDRRAGVLRLADTTHVLFGLLPLTLGGSLDRHGPRVRMQLAADALTDERIKESLPKAVLGPLLDVAVRGSFDYRLRFDLDLANPDSVDFAADVIPHGLTLDPARTRLPLFDLDRPFIAAIHLPRDRIVYRELRPSNPYYHPLEQIDSVLALAVVTNEDGGFFRHRGFNVEAMKDATAENLKAGSFRRGAGTITMQLARNLFLGHRRTLSRKGQEIVLAWVLEHLTGLSKRRLLEIYLNIIEWGPGVHGAGEATRYYFAHDPGAIPVPEALFLTIIVPSPNRWRSRVDSDGQLRRYARAQMHYIGRAMVAKGWLRPEALPPRDSLRVELRGPARGLVFPADTLRSVSSEEPI